MSFAAFPVICMWSANLTSSGSDFGNASFRPASFLAARTSVGEGDTVSAGVIPWRLYSRAYQSSTNFWNVPAPMSVIVIPHAWRWVNLQCVFVHLFAISLNTNGCLLVDGPVARASATLMFSYTQRSDRPRTGRRRWSEWGWRPLRSRQSTAVVLHISAKWSSHTGYIPLLILKFPLEFWKNLGS